MEDLTGKRLDRYQVIGPLGEGGMAAVYKAYQSDMERHVALKILPRYFASDPLFVRRFHQEARVIANLQHPHILPVFDFGETDGYTYIVMPFVESGTLADQLHDEPLTLSQIHKVITQVGDALDYAHSQGLVHRDVKPSNVLMDERGNSMLTDFGIVKIVEGTTQFTQTGGILGTPAYMSPEQGLGEELDRRSDIYSLGVMLYEMATGHPPFKAETPMAIVLKHINDQPAPPRTINPTLPHDLEQVILRALEKRPEDRYPTTTDMVMAFHSSLRDSIPTQKFIPPDLDETVHEGVITRTEQEPQIAAQPPVADVATPLPEARHGRRLKMPAWGWILGSLIVMGMIAGLSSVVLNWIKPTTPQAAAVASRTKTSSPTGTLVPTTVLSDTPAPTPVPSDTVMSTLEPTIMPAVIVDHGVSMVLVPAGSFTMGSETGYSYEQPAHEVWLDAFYIDQYEVTNAQYKECADAGYCDPDHTPWSNLQTRIDYYGNPQFDDYPVIYLDWSDARNYCIWRGARLPTEAEWEKAARGTDGRRYPWGNEPPDDHYANFNKNVGDTIRVGSYPAGVSPYGAYDMAGNVSEWVNDWYGADYYTISLSDNPIGPSSGEYHVVRGGAWHQTQWYLQTFVRYWSKGRSVLGVRCARSP
jgi:serine/threonine protein kinase